MRHTKRLDRIGVENLVGLLNTVKDEYLSAQNNTEKDESYDTEREAAEREFNGLLKWLGYKDERRKHEENKRKKS
jgi:hypothetical protein